MSGLQGQVLANAIRAHLDTATGGRDPSITGYVERLREGHQATLRVSDAYGGCTCGSPLCPIAVLIVHIDNLTAETERLRKQFADETARNLGDGRLLPEAGVRAALVYEGKAEWWIDDVIERAADGPR